MWWYTYVGVPVTTCLGLVVHGIEVSDHRSKQIASTGSSGDGEQVAVVPKWFSTESEPVEAEFRTIRGYGILRTRSRSIFTFPPSGCYYHRRRRWALDCRMSEGPKGKIVWEKWARDGVDMWSCGMGLIPKDRTLDRHRTGTPVPVQIIRGWNVNSATSTRSVSDENSKSWTYSTDFRSSNVTRPIPEG